MVFKSGSCTRANLGNTKCVFFTATEETRIDLLRTKISPTGNATEIYLKINNNILRTIHFSNLDSSFVTSNVPALLQAGDIIYFETSSSSYNASATYELDYTLLAPPPPTVNKLINITFTNGENVINAILTENDAAFIEAKAIGAPHFQIQSITDTNQSVTSTFAVFAQRIDEIGFSTPPEPDPTPEPPPPTPEPNVSVIIDMHDGHFLAAILTEADFNQLHSLNQPGWNIIESVTTAEHPTHSFIEINIDIQSHIAGDEPGTPPPTPDANIFVIVGFENGHVNIEATLTPEDASFVVFKLQGATVYFLAQFQDVNDPVTETFAAFSQRMDEAAFNTPPTPDPVPSTDMVSQSPGVFDLKDDRLTGEILFIANTAFNPFFFGKTLFSFLSIQDPNGVQIGSEEIKSNELFFTDAERTENIFYDEGAFGNTKLTIKAFVFTLDAAFNSLAFSPVLEFTVNEADPPVIPPTTTPGTKLSTLLNALPALGFFTLLLNSARKGNN